MWSFRYHRVFIRVNGLSKTTLNSIFCVEMIHYYHCFFPSVDNLL